MNAAFWKGILPRFFFHEQFWNRYVIRQKILFIDRHMNRIVPLIVEGGQKEEEEGEREWQRGQTDGGKQCAEV